MKQLKAMRLHIGVFGKTNVGKSSFINKITNQDVSIVSDIAGTTTDVVEKSMELPPIGAVTFLDTAGLDDETDLAEKRIEKTKKVISRCDIAIIVCDYKGLDEDDTKLIMEFDELKIPYIIIVNKCDINNSELRGEKVIHTSVKTDEELVDKFKHMLVEILPEDFVNPPKIVGDLVNEKDVVILVTPIDKEAPKGRMILPQVQALRDLLDSNCIVMFTTEFALKETLESLKNPPALVVTDSQAFKIVNETVPENIMLTSFSMLFARLKGDLKEFVKGAKAIDNLKDGDRILILESCTHHAIDDDIATVKIPRWLEKKTGKNLIIEYSTGHDFPKDITPYKLIIHCGACMTNRREILSRIIKAQKHNVPISNYGVVISYCLGILDRAIKPFLNH